MIKKCLICGKEFNTKISRIKIGRGKFCSRRCFGQSQRGKSPNKTSFKKGQISWNKGTKGIMKANKTSFKKGEHRGLKTEFKRETTIGKNHWNWKGGITPLTYKIRRSFEMRQWRLNIFTRDSFICQECGDSKGGNLEAHHIKKLAQILEDYKIKTFEEALNCKKLWDINNGLTLCKECHKLTKNYGKKK